MLNNIRGILNRRNDSSKSPESPSRTSSVDGGDFQTSSAEGFICPTCIHAFPSAEILQNHYESTHSESESSLEGRIAFICSACKMKLGSEIELKSHYTRHHSGTKEEVEIETMLLQIKALEEGKALLNGQLLAIQSQASELTKENARTREERDSFKIKLTKQMDELANLKMEYDKVKSMKSSIESSLQSSKEKIRTLEIEIQQRPEADDVSLLQKELVSVQKMMDELTRQREAEKDVLKTQCNEVQEICLRLQAEKTELENNLKNYPKKDEFSNLQKKITEMSETIAKLERELMHKDAENKSLSENLKRKSNYDEMKTLIAEKNAALEDVQRICSEKDTQIVKLKEELKSATVNIQEMKTGREKLFLKIEEGEGASAAMLQLKEENIRLQDQYRQQLQLQNVADNEAEMKLEDLRSSLKKKYEERICEINAEKEVHIKDLNGSIEALKKRRELDVSKINELNTLLDNKSKMIEKLSLDMEKVKDQSKKDQQAYEKHTQHLGFEKKNLEKRLSDLGDTLPKLETELLEKKKLLSQAEDKLKQLSQQQEKENLLKITELNQLQEQHKDNLSKIENLEKCVSEFELSKVEFCDKISSLNEELLKSQLKESELSAKIDHFYEEHSSVMMKNTLLEEESANLRSSVTTLQNEKNSLLDQIEFTKKDLVELHELMADKEKQCKELTEILQQQNGTLSKLKSGHKVERDILIKEKLELQKDLESVKNSCEKQVSQIQETVTSLENQLTEAEEKTVLMKSALDEASKVIKRKEKEFEEKESHYTAQLGVFTENVNTLREDLFSEQKQKDILQQNLDEITGSKLALEAKFENVLDERKSLLQRCLQSESECERLQKSSGDMRRKYDDCVAALQELGRENQTLQVENMKHVTRKWADDAEVINCTACTKLFTVTIRKHHCRNCGSIFCNECSSKTTTVAASKKPVRVCDVCYDEITK